MCYVHQPMPEIDWFPLTLSLSCAYCDSVCRRNWCRTGVVAGAQTVFGRELLDAAVTLPLVLPPTVLGYYLLVLLGRRSPVGQAIESLTGQPLVFTWRGAVVAAGIGALPLVVKTSRTAIAAVDTNLEDAARTLGQSEWRILASYDVARLSWNYRLLCSRLPAPSEILARR